MARRDRIVELKEIEDGLYAYCDTDVMTLEILARRLARVIEIVLQDWADENR